MKNAFDVQLQRKDNLKSRRHSHSMGNVKCEEHFLDYVDAKRRSRRSTISSDDTTSSFGTMEYSSLIDSWVGDCWGEMEDQLMRLSGNDFKAFALSPNVASGQADPIDNNLTQKLEDEPETLSSAVTGTHPPIHSTESAFSERNWEAFREARGGTSPIRMETFRETKGGASPSRMTRLNSRR